MMDNKETIDRLGIYKCGQICEKIGYIFREQTICDYGIDAIIERKDEKYPSGKLIAVQIKSGDSYFKEMKEDKVVFRGENKHYNYWLNHSLPVIIVLYSPTKDKLIWESFNEQKTEKTEKGWKINIPYNQKLEDSRKQLQELADNQSEYERRWNSLVVAKEWMLETIRHGESSDIPPKIYPYANGAGEVDFYRLKLTLNQIGKAFIEMENFLETGKCYLIDKIKI